MNELTPARSEADDVLLDVCKLAKTFGHGPTAVDAIAEIDLSVRRGEVLLVMGPSGSGKTTLLSLIGGLLRPTTGTVRIAGVEVTALGERELPRVRLRFVGFVFQSFNLLEALTAVENVQVPMNLAGLKGHEARQKAEQLLIELGMGSRLKFKPNALSGGEKQRVSIARALANDPDLILADEPTANLDSRQGRAVVKLFRDIASERNRAVIIVTHDDRIREIADRILWLEDGRFREDGAGTDQLPGGLALPEHDSTRIDDAEQ